MAIILGLDLGEKRIGLALSDEDERVAVAAGTLTVSSDQEALQVLGRFVEDKGVEKIVLGLPLSLSGKASQQTQRVQGFMGLLEEAVSCPVDFQDERFSTVEATRRNIPGQSVDERSAVLILQTYLDRKRKDHDRK